MFGLLFLSPHLRATSSGSVSLNSPFVPSQVMQPELDESDNSSNRNCQSCICPDPKCLKENTSQNRAWNSSNREGVWQIKHSLSYIISFSQKQSISFFVRQTERMWKVVTVCPWKKQVGMLKVFTYRMRGFHFRGLSKDQNYTPQALPELASRLLEGPNNWQTSWLIKKVIDVSREWSMKNK